MIAKFESFNDKQNTVDDIESLLVDFIDDYQLDVKWYGNTLKVILISNFYIPTNSIIDAFKKSEDYLKQTYNCTLHYYINGIDISYIPPDWKSKRIVLSAIIK